MSRARNTGQPRQLPLDLATAPALSRDDLVVSDANREALAALDAWPEWRAPAMILAGPPGAGKSHLAAIWARRSGALRIEPSRLDVLPPGARQFLLDDADAPPVDEVGLFHLINHVRAVDGHLLMTARRFPAAWGVRLPDLASRLRAATLVEIGEPDDALLAAVVTKLFADRQVEVDAVVVLYLVRRMERSLDAARRLVERLDLMAMERKVRITRALAAEVVGGEQQSDPT
jgi:chromosomal replication initiation ATPase DnaA